MILYICKQHGPLAELEARGAFDLRLTCRCGSPGIPCNVHESDLFTKNEHAEKVNENCFE